MAQKGNTVIVTNVASDGPRLKVWAVMDKKNYSYVEKAIGMLNKKFNEYQGLPGPQTPVLPNSLCCVKYRGSYVRAKICAVQQNGVVVQLIDNGVIDILPMDLIRLLYSNSEEEHLLLSLPPLAAEFTLANVVSISEKWESRSIEAIKSFIKDKELEVSHYDMHNNRYLVKLVYGAQDIGNMLVNKRMAKMATLDEMFKSEMYSQQPPYKGLPISHQQQITGKEIAANGYSDAQHVYNAPPVVQIPIQPNMGPESWRFNQQPYAYQQNHPQHNAVQRTMPPRKQDVEEEPQPTVLEFRGRLLQVGAKYHAFVSYVEDGPAKFSVQIRDMKGILMQLMTDIQKHEPIIPLKEPPLPGSVCLARLNNKCLCRAVVMATMETQIKIYFVDFGNTEFVPYTDIYQLPPKFINPKVLSIRICLTGLKELNITEEVKKYFDNLIKAKDVDLLVCEPEGPFLIQYGEVFFNGKNVKEYLKDRFPDIALVTYGHLPSLTDGTKETVYISYVASCSRFFVQLEKNMKDIEEMMAAVSEYATTAPPVNQLSVGSICIAPYDLDKQWYRVKILKINGDNVNVLYVDYGNEDTVSVNQLRAIRKDLVAQVPSQAIHCVLNGFQNRDSNKLFDTQFENLTFEKRLSMLVRNAQPSCLIVDLFDISTTPPKNILPEINKIATDSSNVHNDSTSSKRSSESCKNPGQNYQRSGSKEHSTVVQHQRTKSKGVKPRDEMDVGKTSVAPDSNQFSLNNDASSGPKPKSWKDDHNEQSHDNQHQRRDDNERFNREGANEHFDRDGSKNHFTRDGGNKPFNRVGGNTFSRDKGNNSFNRDGGNDRFNRDGGNDRFNRDGGNERFNRSGGNDRFNREGNDRFNREGNDRFNRDGPRNERNNFRDGGRFNQFSQNENNRNDRSGRGRFVSNKRDQNFTSDRFPSSDSESTTSSRGSGKRGERGGFQGRKERDNNRSSRFNKFGNRDDSDGFRPRGNEDNNGHNFRTRSARDDEFVKPKEMINFDAVIDFSEPKKCQIPMPNVTIGSINKCELVYLTNPSNFFIHLIPENLKLDGLMEEIASIYETGGMILESSKVKPDVACIAQYTDDEKWYRAIIKSVEDNTASVLFIDYGNVEKVNFDKLKEIREEFIQLPMQAVPCKLFGPKKTDWSNEEIESFGDATNGKYLQAEFITKDKDVFQVLLREVDDEVVKPEIINESFCQVVDLVKAKETVLNKGKVSSGNFEKNQPEYTSTDSRWSEEKVSPGKKEPVLVTWFDNPESFYCQSINKQRVFRPMMEEIQSVYVKRQPVSDTLQPGSPVIAVFPDDRALYRAEIVEVNANRNHIVQYVDFGNRASVDQRNMYPVEKRFMMLPKQAIRCSLKNVIPANGGSWSNINSPEIEKYFDADEFECTYHEVKDDRVLVSLSNKGTDLAGSLVEKKLALFSVADSAPTFSENATIDSADIVNTPRFDIKLLPGQTLRAKVSNVESVSKFYLQFSSAEDCNRTVSSYMANKDPQVMPRLSSHEVCLGAGCLLFTDGVWRRAVVVNCAEATSFDVRLIDTGAYDKMSLDCMLALPSQLSMMQNQAIECSLQDIQPSSSLNETLKNLVENKDVIIHVNEVDNTRLIVQLYDLLGCKIQLTDDASESKISPVCPMPIFSSTHKVNVSGADHSNSLWLQMSSDAEKDEKLNREMAEFYSEDRESFVPEPNKLCVVKNQDGTWCRAMIIRKTDSGVLVKLIDYGISKDVSCDRLKVLDPRFYVPHQLAIHVSLNVTLRGTPAEQIKALKPHLQGKEFTATFYNVRKKWLVELVENGVKLSETLTSLNLVKETTVTKTEETPGGKYKVKVTHADSPAQFWMQRFDEIPILEELQNELQNAVSGYPSVDKVLEEGSLCAAVFEGSWCRAEVIDADEDITSVRFIDFGKTDVINNKPGNIKELPDSIKIKKAYGIKCRLDVIPVDSEDWSDATCERFSNLVKTDNCLEAVLIAESVPKRVDLFVDGKSVSDILVEEGHASKVRHEEELVEEIVEIELDPRSAFISHIYSPSEFFVQEEKSVSDLEKIQDRFLVADMLPKVTDITEGLLCVAKFTDNEWYRARVISQNETGTKVLFVDYGNSAVVTEIRAIPEDVASIPPLSRKCSLQMPSYVSHWPENALENFCELAAEGATIFLMDVLKEGETTIVKLTLENEDIAEKLAPPRSIFISHINSPSDFWVQDEKTLSEIDKLQERLCEAENYPDIEVKEGLICVAKFLDDEQWYRAKVLSQNENKTVVLFIDYGNFAPSTEIRAIPEDLASVAPFAKKCNLQLPSYAEEWPQDAFDNFCTLAADGNVAFFLDVIEEKETAIVNLFLGKENIAEKLVPRVSEKQLEERYVIPETENSGPEKEATITCTVIKNGTIIPEEDILTSEVPLKKVVLIPVYISQLNSLSEFWVQEEKTFDDIQKMENTLLSADDFPQLDEIKEGVICTAKFPSDSLWYRAQILSQDENGTVVSFIDYGNSCVVTELRTLPEDVAALPVLAKKCGLKLPQNIKHWPQEAFSKFSKLSANGTTCFSMNVLEDRETAIVNLYLDGESIANKLAFFASQEISVEQSIVLEKGNDIPEEESAIPEKEIVSPEKESSIPEREIVPPEKESALPERKRDIAESDVDERENDIAEREIVPPEKESALPERERDIAESDIAEKESDVAEKESAIAEKEGTISENVPVDIQEDKPATIEKVSPKLNPVSVFITQLNSPKEFWVQEESASKLAEIGKKLLNIEECQRVEEPVEGLIYAAQFPDDQVWYRAEIVSFNENEMTVCFIDHGSQSPVTELRLLPEDLVALPPLAKKCSLKLPLHISEWPQEAYSEFSNFYSDGTSFLMDVLEEGDPAIVDLKLNGESVADKLLASIPQKLAKKETAVIGQQEEKSVTEEEVVGMKHVKLDEETGKLDASSILLWNVISPNEFWGQVGNDSANVQDQLLHADGWPLVEEVKEGMLCAAKVKEEWHRACVQSINNGDIQVLIIDRGYTPICTEFRQLPLDLVSKPALSRKYALKLPENVDEWTQAATAAFRKYSETSFTMEFLEDGEVPVIKLLHHGEDVSEILASMLDDFSSEIDRRLPPEGEENLNMTTSHVNSPSMLWGQTEFTMPELDAMTEVDSKKSKENKIEEIDLTGESGKPEETKTIHESPISAFQSGTDTTVEKIADSTQLSHEVELEPSCDMEKEDAKDLSSTLQESKQVDLDSTVPFFTADKEQPIPIGSELTVDELMGRMICEPEENIEGNTSQEQSETEIVHSNIERCRSIPYADKIEPENIFRVEELSESDSEVSNKSESITMSYAVPEPSPSGTPNTSIVDTIVADSVLSKESPVVELPRPPTPKTSQSEKIEESPVVELPRLPMSKTPLFEKIVAAVVSLQEEFIEAEKDEILNVYADENIPQ